MDKRMKEWLDRHITGNYGEDQFKGDFEEEDFDVYYPEEEDEEFCDEDCKKCKMKVSYTMFDTEDDGYID